MEFGMFVLPAHPPERTMREVVEWNLQVIRWMDEYGFTEAWVGEHHNVPWEPIPAPDLLLARAFAETKRIRLGPGGFILPYHHPAELANRLSMLDHMSGGRLNFGVAAGSIPIDWEMFHVDGAKSQNRDMTLEALEIILRLWTEQEPWTHKGKFWSVTKPAREADIFWPHLYPLQKPHPPIGMTGSSSGSGTLRFAGERGFLPMSFGLNIGTLRSHWEAVEAGATRAGRTASRKDWRLSGEVFVADTDAEATKIASDRAGMMARFALDYARNIGKAFALRGLIPVGRGAPPPSAPQSTEELARGWIVGSPDTVAAKLQALQEATGGFGTLLIWGYDFLDKPEAWRHSLELLGREVLPRVKAL